MATGILGTADLAAAANAIMSPLTKSSEAFDAVVDGVI